MTDDDPGRRAAPRATRGPALTVTLALLTLLLGVIGIGTAAPAYAKADIWFTAGPHNARVGRPIRLTGDAADDNATFNRFCVQQRYGHGGWQVIRCARGAYNGGGGLNIWVRPRRRGLVFFRAVLFEGRSATDHHPRVHLVSRAFALAVT